MKMAETALFIADTPLKPCPGPVAGACVELDGEPFYRIANYSRMPPFLMSLVSDSDHWLFISSNGALTAGRRDADHALFPYYTDDRIHDSQDQTGSATLLRVAREGRTYLWEPFSQRMEGLYRGSRSLYKSAYGNTIIFEEVNEDLALVFSYAWMTSERFGFIRRAAVKNQGGAPAQIELLDGIQNIMPYGLTRRFQVEFSTLADGYRESELEARTGLGLFRLSSIPTDKAEPSEALRVTTVWSQGLENPKVLLSPSSLERFRKGDALREETNIRGRRGAYLLNARLDLAPGDRKEWLLVCGCQPGCRGRESDARAARGGKESCGRDQGGRGAGDDKPGAHCGQRGWSSAHRGPAEHVAAFLERPFQCDARGRAGSGLPDLAR